MMLLITGERDWTDRDQVWQEISDELVGWDIARGEVMLSLGDCPTGVDKFALEWAENYGCPYIMHRAEWGKHGNAAGPMRNGRMVAAAAEHTGSRAGIAFWSGKTARSGTLDCMSQATAAGIYVRIVPRKT